MSEQDEKDALLPSSATLPAAESHNHHEMVVREDALAAAKDYLMQSKSPATWRAYVSDWRWFEAWCASAGLQSLPADANTVMLFISAEA